MNLYFCPSLILVSLNSLYIYPGILPLNGAPPSRPHSWFCSRYFSSRILKWWVAVNEGAASFCVDDRVMRELCRCRVVSCQFCRGIWMCQ